MRRICTIARALFVGVLALALQAPEVQADSTAAPPTLSASAGSAPNRFAERFEVYTYVSGYYSMGRLLQVQTTVSTGALGVQDLSASAEGYVETWSTRGLQCSVAITGVDPNTGNITLVVGIPIMTATYYNQYRSCRITLSGAAANVPASNPVNIRASVTGPVIAQTQLVCESCNGY